MPTPTPKPSSSPTPAPTRHHGHERDHWDGACGASCGHQSWGAAKHATPRTVQVGPGGCLSAILQVGDRWRCRGGNQQPCRRRSIAGDRGGRRRRVLCLPRVCRSTGGERGSAPPTMRPLAGSCDHDGACDERARRGHASTDAVRTFLAAGGPAAQSQQVERFWNGPSQSGGQQAGANRPDHQKKLGTGRRGCTAPKAGPPSSSSDPEATQSSWASRTRVRQWELEIADPSD
jgi:hypothetical protein